jgi:hypothetical protein
MKKFARLSLVAAVAVAGMTTANAKDLSEAIKNTDISGTMTYRYDDRTSDDAANANFASNSYKIAVTLKSKINENITAVTRGVIGSGNAMVGLPTDGGDGEATFGLTQANFVVKAGAATVIAGKQAVPSPFAVQADAAGDEDTGTGLVAVANVGPVTLAGGYFNQTNLVTAGQDIAALGVMAKVGPAAIDAWYLNVLESSATNDGHVAYSVGAKAKVSAISVYGRYSSVTPDVTDDAETLWKVGASAKFGIVGAAVHYGATNDVTTYQRGVNLTGDADAKANLQGWSLNLNGNDRTLLKTNVNVDVMKGVNVALNYNMLDNGAATQSDDVEYYGQLTYKAGKNFMTYVRFGQVDKEARTDKETRGRVHVQYSF